MFFTFFIWDEKNAFRPSNMGRKAQLAFRDTTQIDTSWKKGVLSYIFYGMTVRF